MRRGVEYEQGRHCSAEHHHKFTTPPTGSRKYLRTQWILWYYRHTTAELLSQVSDPSSDKRASTTEQHACQPPAAATTAARSTRSRLAADTSSAVPAYDLTLPNRRCHVKENGLRPNTAGIWPAADEQSIRAATTADTAATAAVATGPSRCQRSEKEEIAAAAHSTAAKCRK